MSDKAAGDMKTIRLGMQIITCFLAFLTPIVVAIAFTLSHIANKLGTQ